MAPKSYQYLPGPPPDKVIADLKGKKALLEEKEDEFEDLPDESPGKMHNQVQLGFIRARLMLEDERKTDRHSPRLKGLELKDDLALRKLQLYQAIHPDQGKTVDEKVVKDLKERIAELEKEDDGHGHP